MRSLPLTHGALKTICNSSLTVANKLKSVFLQILVCLMNGRRVLPGYTGTVDPFRPNCFDSRECRYDSTSSAPCLKHDHAMSSSKSQLRLDFTIRYRKWSMEDEKKHVDWVGPRRRKIKVYDTTHPLCSVIWSNRLLPHKCMTNGSSIMLK